MARQARMGVEDMSLYMRLMIYKLRIISIYMVIKLVGKRRCQRASLQHKKLTGINAHRFVDHFNPGHLGCYHQVVCKYYGEPYHQPQQCCKAPGCSPGPPNNYQFIVDHYVKKLTQSKNINPLTLHHDNKTLEKYDGSMMKFALRSLHNWQGDIWSTCKEGVNNMTHLEMDHQLLHPINPLSSLHLECIKHIPESSVKLLWKLGIKKLPWVRRRPSCW